MRTVVRPFLPVCLTICSFLGHGAPRPSTWISIPASKLCVTEGALGMASGGGFSVTVAKMRAFVTAYTLQEIEARFTYFGGVKGEKPLRSGEMRRQFGLKLRARDACNLVYAMWRIDPESQLVVSVKSNPGQHTSAECGNRGYHNVKPERSSPVPFLRPGDAHTLRGAMKGSDLRVFADDKLVWEGSVGSEAERFVGPVGIRSDNAKLEIELRAAEPDGANPKYQLTCRRDSGENE